MFEPKPLWFWAVGIAAVTIAFVLEIRDRKKMRKTTKETKRNEEMNG
ncbi:hypothetical protein [Paenibacillus thermotolerans]|nr:MULTISPECIES: hypothetical protein [unclassified Paenibacillus]